MLAAVIRCIIFDLDGTLVHSLPGIAASLNRTLKSSGHPTHPEATVRGFIGNGIRKLVERGTPEINSELLDTLVETIKADYAATWKDGTTPYPGVIDTLQTLANQAIACAVFSNKPDEYCREITDFLFPNIHFPVVRGQLPGTPAKPDPAGALSICRELNINPADSALVGDSTIDLETAKNAGMISIAATWGYHDPPALAELDPDHSINTMSELPKTLNL